MAVNYSGILLGLSLVLQSLCAGGCAIKRAQPVFGAVDELSTVDPSFVAGLEFLSGFDEPEGNSQGTMWQPDDWVLLGVKLAHDGQNSVWFVRLSTLPGKQDAAGEPAPTRVREFSVPFGVGSIKPRTRFVAPAGRICIETYTHDGSFMQSSVRVIPQSLHSSSLMELCCDLQRRSGDYTEATTSPERIRSMASLTVMLQSIGMCGALEPIRAAVREKIVKAPSLMDVVLAGLRLRLETHMSRPESLTMPWTKSISLGPCEQSRFPVCLAGQPLFDCRLISGPAAPPYHLSAGMLLFEAVHPEKPENRLTIRVLAAKRLGTN